MNAWLLLILNLAFLEALFINQENIAFPCETPAGEHAYCVSLFSCPHLMKSLSTLDPEAIDYTRRSICMGCEAGDFMVCCGSPKQFTVETSTTQKTVANVPPKVDVDALKKETKEARREYVRTKLLPSQRICGQQHTDDYVYERNETALDEFPWMVHLEKVDPNEMESFKYYHYILNLKCNGVLISSRYVLTTQNCRYFINRVKLGQYSTHQNVTCVQESSTLLDCTDPIVRRDVEKYIVSDDYNRYNLALLRLNESVEYSDYIRPICLPIDGSKRPTSENYLTFSGFGAQDEGEVLKKRITYNLTNLQVCNDADEDADKKLRLRRSTETLACLVPPPGNTLASCFGDLGSPLMYKYKHKWFADAFFIAAPGIYDVEDAPCSATQPILGAYITPTIMNWILDNIED